VISPRAIALEGVGFSPRVFAMVGFSVVSSVSVDAPAWITLAIVSQCGIYTAAEHQAFCGLGSIRVGLAESAAVEQSAVAASEIGTSRASWMATLASDCVVSVAAMAVRQTVASTGADLTTAGARASLSVAQDEASIIVTERTRIES
jgi:hypothetical protein